MVLEWRDDEARARFEGLGLTALDRLEGDLDEPRLAELGQQVTTALTRRLYLLDPGYYVKVQVARPGVLPPRKWISYAAKPSPLLREARAYEVLDGLGFKTPSVLARGARGRFPFTVRAALITRALPDHIDVERCPPERRAEAATAVEQVVARIHAAGYSLGKARYRDFLVPNEGHVDPDSVVLIDAASLSRGTRRRRNDLRHLERERERLV